MLCRQCQIEDDGSFRHGVCRKCRSASRSEQRRQWKRNGKDPFSKIRSFSKTRAERLDEFKRRADLNLPM